MNAKTQIVALMFGSVLLSSVAFAADDATKQTDPAAQKDGAQTQQPAQPASDATTQSNQPAAKGDATAQMKSLDADKDGAISKAEAGKMQGLTDTFDMADKNKNGKLDSAEFATALSDIKK
jgi:EF hand